MWVIAYASRLDESRGRSASVRYYEVRDRFLESHDIKAYSSWKERLTDRLSSPADDWTTIAKRFDLVSDNELEFLKLHADVNVIGRDNARRTDVCRKNGIIVNDGRTCLGPSSHRQHDS